MTIMKTIVCYVVYFIIGLVKVPFTFIVGLGLSIEKGLMKLMTLVAKWYGDEAFIEAVNIGLEGTSFGAECYAEMYNDMKIEL